MSLVFSIFGSIMWTNEEVPRGSPYNHMEDHMMTLQMMWQVMWQMTVKVDGMG
jgi:hypothetical protein